VSGPRARAKVEPVGRGRPCRAALALGGLVGIGLALNGCPEARRTTAGDEYAAYGGAAHENGGGARARASVVATVNGRPIASREVAELARAAGLSPREALDRLVARELLAAEARRRGLDARAPLRAALAREARRAAVRAWLTAEVEGAAPPVVVDDADVDAAYERERTRFVKPEKRASVHVLIALGPQAEPAREDAARRLAARVLEELRAGDPADIVAKYAADPSPLGGAFRVRAEAVHALAREDAADPAYTRALFEVPGPGVVGAPVRSSFGWHAIAVTRVEPEVAAPREEVRAALEAERTTEARRAALAARLAAAAAERPPRYAERAEAALAGLDALLERGP
jgi:parvulin-like peptidyl-prolyl isomerase